MSEEIRQMIDKVKNFNQFVNENEYENYTTCVIALFFNNKVLILQRGDTAPWMPNKWSLVGGVVDDGENEFETIEREVKEEISLSPKNIKFVKKIKTEDAGNIVYFIGNLDSNEIILDYENQAYKFIEAKEIDDFDYVPYVRDFIKSLV
jgi:8-oxo-dGTP pyrophosphatase MutT (NUDIX family)